jgi:hypothetical protein
MHVRAAWTNDLPPYLGLGVLDPDSLVEGDEFDSVYYRWEGADVHEVRRTLIPRPRWHVRDVASISFGDASTFAEAASLFAQSMVSMAGRDGGLADQLRRRNPEVIVVFAPSGAGESSWEFAYVPAVALCLVVIPQLEEQPVPAIPTSPVTGVPIRGNLAGQRDGLVALPSLNLSRRIRPFEVTVPAIDVEHVIRHVNAAGLGEPFPIVVFGSPMATEYSVPFRFRTATGDPSSETDAVLIGRYLPLLGA